MLPNKARLRSSQKIGTIFKRGKYSHGKLLLLKYLPNDANSIRVAISVSTKLFKQAIRRNRIKRLVREAIKPHLTDLPKMDILIIVKASVSASTPLSEIKADLDNLLLRLYHF